VSIKTRLWLSAEGSNTAVQFRTDTKQPVWVHTNIGWVNIKTPKDLDEAERLAEEMAAGYELKEADEEVARYFLGER